jgi:dihydrofolate reductase
MSLDGYATASGVRPDEPMGDGLRLHEWAFGDDERGRAVLAESQGGAGASIAGRRTCDLSIPRWGPDGPGGPARTPTFIVSHRPPDGVPEGGVYTFAASPEDAVAQARAVAGDKDVDTSAPGIGQQALRAGLVDEARIHHVPVLLRAGTRLFGDIGHDHVQLKSPRSSRSRRRRTCGTPSSGASSSPAGAGRSTPRRRPRRGCARSARRAASAPGIPGQTDEFSRPGRYQEKNPMVTGNLDMGA